MTDSQRALEKAVREAEWNVVDGFDPNSAVVLRRESWDRIQAALGGLGRERDGEELTITPHEAKAILTSLNPYWNGRLGRLNLIEKLRAIAGSAPGETKPQPLPPLPHAESLRRRREGSH